MKIGNVEVEDKGKPFVIGVDTFDHTDWLEGHYDSNEEAINQANAKGGTMLKMHAYNKEGEHIGEGGTF